VFIEAIFTNFSQLILWKIIKEIVVTRYQILSLKCAKVHFFWVTASALTRGKGQENEGRDERGGA